MDGAMVGAGSHPRLDICYPELRVLLPRFLSPLASSFSSPWLHFFLYLVDFFQSFFFTTAFLPVQTPCLMLVPRLMLFAWFFPIKQVFTRNTCLEDANNNCLRGQFFVNDFANHNLIYSSCLKLQAMIYTRWVGLSHKKIGEHP